MPRRSSVFVVSFAVLAVLLLGVACSKKDATAPYRPPAECSTPGPPSGGGTQAIVAIRGFAFTPDTLRIGAGTTVTWVNCETPDIDAHTATATGGGAWDSGYLPPGAKYTRPFTTAGSFGYGCLPHPFMKGAVIVQ